MNAILITYSYSQILELCATFSKELLEPVNCDFDLHSGDET